MDKKTLQTSILEAAYQPEKWMEVIKLYFGAKKFHQTPQQIILPGNNLAEKALEIGSFYTVDERLIGIYEIQLTAKAWIDKNRVGLRNLLRQVYKYDVDGALIVFVQNDKWRFSYVSEIRTEEGKKETEPKRYTYLFGKGESCRTAADRFDKIKGKPIYINDLFDAFSVDKLNKDFFKSYKEFFESFSDHLAKQSHYRKVLLASSIELEKGWRDEQAKPIRDFAKKLLGRIVFLQFLQKKGWMGVPSSNLDWIGGDVKFLQNLFHSYPDKDHFHSKALKTLFFETLNSKRANQIAPAVIGKNIKIPYLNGGLFDKDVSFENLIDFPADLFKNLLDFFEAYNFTIDENDPYDSEVGIDPEMLGHIFENLLEENREKGAFYTPKEIVHYMCQESLIQYLRTHLPECTEDESPATKVVEAFIRSGITGDRNDRKNFVVQQAKRIEKLLDNIKICDPAIGSGAFPMGMLQEIFKAKTALDLTLDHAEVKKQIIQNCIYGVDIENGAVDIARLRFWLALVVDETEPQPLPNLDYKIMQGNSLLESFEGIDLSKVHTVSKTTTLYEPQKDLFGNIINPQLKFTYVKVLQENNLQQLMLDFFNETNPTKKAALRQTINQTVHDHIDYNLELWQLSLERQVAEAPDINKQGLKVVTKKKIEELHAQLESLKGKRKKLHNMQSAVNKPYFLWHLFFADVFEKGGFDIVIGNPPYIKVQSLPKELVTYFKQNFESATGKYDIYVLFIEFGLRLLKKNGLLIFINPHRFLITEYGGGIRNLLIRKKAIHKAVYFGAEQIFEAAMTYTGIFLLKENSKYLQFALPKTKNLNDLKYFTKKYDSGFNFNFLVDKSSNAILDKIIIHKQVKEIFEGVYQGIIPMGDDIQILEGKIQGDFFIGFSNELDSEVKLESKILKPILKGENIKRYQPCETKNYIFYPHFIDETGKTKPFEEEYLKNKYPLSYNYIKNFETILRDRKVKYKTNPNYWYSLHRSRDGNIFERKKIITPQLQNNSSFTIDQNRYYADAGGYIILPKQDDLGNIETYLGIFNSKLFYYFIKITSTPYNNDYYYFKTNYIEPFCIPDLDEKFKQITRKLVIQILTLKSNKLNSIMLENKIDALVFHLYNLTESEMLQVLDTFKDLSIKDRNQIQNEYWNIANNKFQLEA